jgi:hypothetical protein
MKREQSLALYERLVATNPDIARKGATMPYTSVNGHMFSLLGKNGAVTLRLPAEAREEFLKKYKSGLSVQYGATMKEYVVVPDGLLRKTEELRAYFDASYAYVSALKPKPTKRKKPAPAKKTARATRKR